jgi:hypothetical protein
MKGATLGLGIIGIAIAMSSACGGSKGGAGAGGGAAASVSSSTTSASGVTSTSSSGSISSSTSTSTSSSTSNATSAGSTGSTSSSSSASSATTASSSGSTSSSSSTSSATSASSSSGGSVVVYAHTDNTLFRYDPSQPAVAPSAIGAFDCIGGPSQDTAMTDLAVNATGQLWGISANNLYTLMLPAGATGPVHCATTYIVEPALPFYGLTFAPKGVLDPNVEVLVGANTLGQLWSIVPNGTATVHAQRGTFGTVPANDPHGHIYVNAGQSWELSGDIVFISAGGTPRGFATVRDCPMPPSTTNCNTTDTLIELDLTALASANPKSVTKTIIGQVVKSNACNDPVNAAYGSLYGIAALGSTVFGFSHLGYVTTIDLNSGTSCLAVATPGQSWAGAGITTSAL